MNSETIFRPIFISSTKINRWDFPGVFADRKSLTDVVGDFHSCIFVRHLAIEAGDEIYASALPDSLGLNLISHGMYS